MQAKNLLIAIVLGVALAAGIWVAANLSPTPSTPTTATVLPAANPVPTFSLVDHTGQDVDESVFVGQWDLVFFGFTHCPDVCPITLNVLATAQRELAAQGVEPLPRIVLVSVDPERDTPELLAHYVDSFGDGHVGLTGELDQIRRLTDGLGVFFNPLPADEQGYYIVDHYAGVIVIDPEGRFHALFGAPHRVENFVHDLPILTAS